MKAHYKENGHKEDQLWSVGDVTRTLTNIAIPISNMQHWYNKNNDTLKMQKKNFQIAARDTHVSGFYSSYVDTIFRRHTLAACI